MSTKIKELRGAANLSQNALAKKIGISSVTTIRNWESGLTGTHTWELAAVLVKLTKKTLKDIAELMPGNPVAKELLLVDRLCEALECNPEDLLVVKDGD